MFFWGLTGQPGRRYQMMLGFAWVASALFAFHSSSWIVSIGVYSIPLLVTVWVTRRMSVDRAELTFTSAYHREHAFPSSRENALRILVFQVAGTLGFLLVALMSILPMGYSLLSKEGVAFLLGVVLLFPYPVGLVQWFQNRSAPS